MNTINLPDALNLDSSGPIIVYNYESRREISKQQILLTSNTFSFLQEGIKELYSDNSSYSIDNNNFLLMSSGHCLMTEKLSEKMKYYNSILVFFTDKIISEFIQKYKLNTNSSHPVYSSYCFTYDDFSSNFVKSIYDISKYSTQYKQELLNIKLEELMLYLVSKNGTDFLHALTIKNNDHSKNFLSTIESNKLNRLTLKELAFLTNTSISTFKREFEKQYNCAPSTWFRDQRLDHAAHLLINKSKRPSDIYHEIGYDTLSSFIQAFRNKFGVTPKQYQS